MSSKHPGPAPGHQRQSRRLPDATMPVCFGCGATRPAQMMTWSRDRVTHQLQMLCPTCNAARLEAL